MHISLFPYHYAFISPSVLSQPLSCPQIEPNWSHLIKQMPKARINTGFRHFSPLFELDMSQANLNLFQLSFSWIWGIFLYQLHYLFRPTEWLLPNCCHEIIIVLMMFCYKRAFNTFLFF